MEIEEVGKRGGRVFVRSCDFCGKSVRIWGGRVGGRGGAKPLSGQRGWLGVYHWPDKDVCLDCLGQYELYRSQT